MLSNFSFIPETPEAYTQCHDILGLPESIEWSSLNVEFGVGQFGSVTLILIPTGEQIRDLAKLAIKNVEDSCVKSDPVPDEQIPADGFGLGEM